MSNTDGARVGSRSWASALCMPVAPPRGLLQVGEGLVDQSPLGLAVELPAEYLGRHLRRQFRRPRPERLQRLVGLDLDFAVQPLPLLADLGLGLGDDLLGRG